MEISKIGEYRIAEELIITRALNTVGYENCELNLSHPRYNVKFSDTGVYFDPTSNAPVWMWHNRTADLIIPSYEDGKIVYNRGAVSEEYVLLKDKIDQQFILKRPLSANQNSLIIEGGVISESEFSKTATGWVWKNGEGEVTLSDVFAFDAKNKPIQACMEVTSKSTLIEINKKDLIDAAYPITIDPEIGTNDFRISNMGSDGELTYFASDPAISYGYNSELNINTYLVVWEGSEAGESEIYGKFLNGTTGAVIGSDFKISNMGPSGNTAFGASDPDVAFSGSEFLVVWHGDHANNNEFEIYGQRIDAVTGDLIDQDGNSGNGITHIRISDMGPEGDVLYGAFSPSVVYNSTGNSGNPEYFVVWYGDDNTAPLVDGENEVFYQRLSQQGDESAFANDVRISEMGSDGSAVSKAFLPDVAWNSASNQYLVVWHADDDVVGMADNEFEIFCRRLLSTGAQTGSVDVRLSDMGPNNNADYSATNASVAYNSITNNYLVIWSGDDTGGATDESEIFGQIVSNLASETGSDFRISDMGPDGNTNFAALNPVVQHDYNLNQFLVTWHGDDNTVPAIDNEFEIYGQLISGVGVEVGSDFRISDVGGSGNTISNAARPAVAYNGNDREFLIVWDADDADVVTLVDNEFEIFGQRFAELSPNPTAQPTAPVFSSVTSSSYNVTFTAATGTPDGYIVLRKSGSSPTDIPLDHSVYNVDDVIGSSTVAYVGSATTFDETGLASSNEYHYDFFSYNGVNSSTNYRTATPLEGNIITLAPEPADQPVTLLFSNPTPSSLELAYTAASGPPDGYLVLRKEGTAPTDIPEDATAYVAGDPIGTSTVAYVGATPDFDDTGLSANSVYHYAIFSFNGSGVTLNYLVTSPLTGSRTTLETEPADQPTLLTFSDVTPTSMNGSFTAASGPPDGYIVIRQANASPTDLPEDGITYTVGATIGASVVVLVGSESSFSSTSLSSGVEYHYDVFSFNGSDDATNYLISAPLEASQVTTVVEPATQPTDITFSTLTPSSMDVSFTAASEAPGGYIVLRKSASSPTDVPIDGISYVAGGTIGTSDIVYVGSEITFSNTGLASCTEYFYDIFPYNGADATINYLVTSPLEGSKSTILAGPTEQPSGITFNAHTTTSYTVNFEAATVSPTGYIAIRKAASAATDVPVDGTDYIEGNTLGDGVVAYVGSTTSFNETGLSPGTTYFYNIYAFNGSGPCINYLTTDAPEESSITVCSKPAVITPVSPQITQTGFPLSWPAVNGAASYKLEISTDDFATLVGGTHQTVDVGADPVQRQVDGLESGIIYKYRVRAVNASGESENSDVASVITIPATPVITQVDNPVQETFEVSWEAITGAEKYFLDVSTNATFTTFAVEAKEVTGTSTTVSGLSHGTTYYLRIRSNNISGSSGHSEIFNKETLPQTPSPSHEEVTSQSFKVKWSQAAGATSYELEVSTNEFVDLLSGYDPATIANGLDIVVTDLDPTTVYKYRVRSKSAAGYSPYSVPVSVTTLEVTNNPTLGVTLSSSNPGSLSPGFGTTKLLVTLTGGTGTPTVTMHWRPILGTAFNQTIAMVSSGNNYEASVTENMMDDIFGLEYFFTATDQTSANPTTDHAFVYYEISTTTPPAIGGLSAGGKAGNYRIISIPYNLEDKSAEVVFNAAGDFGDKTTWRLVRYDNGKNTDVQRFASINPGVGYWFNSVKPVEIKLGEGTVPKYNQSSPFTLLLAQGWNQIGDPFPFNIDWDDVREANPSLTLSNLKGYDEKIISFKNITQLSQWSGGFVFAEESGTLTFPVTLKNTAGGREPKPRIINSHLDQSEWLLPLTLKHGIAENDMIGIGMHPEASESKDKFDEISVPRFVKYLEMETKHEEYFAPYFSQDVVPTTDQYTWNFTVHSNFGEEKATLVWDAEALGNNAAKLILYDVEAQQFIDMKASRQYSFNIGEGKRFKLIFTNSDYRWKPDFTTLGKPYPNPSSGQVMLPLVIEKESTPVIMNIMDMFGKPVRALVNQNFDQGIYDIEWNGEDDRSVKVSNGMYLIQMKVGSLTNKIVQKVIIK